MHSLRELEREVQRIKAKLMPPSRRGPGLRIQYVDDPHLDEAGVLIVQLFRPSSQLCEAIAPAIAGAYAHVLPSRHVFVNLPGPEGS